MFGESGLATLARLRLCIDPTGFMRPSGCTTMDAHDVFATIAYIADDPLYNVEKPYACLFPVDDTPGAKSSNHVFDRVQTLIKDVREYNDHGLDTSGFTFVKCETALKVEDFDSYDTVRDRYFPELRLLLHRLFPQYSEIIYMDHNVGTLSLQTLQND
jgi:hypothetical protein